VAITSAPSGLIQAARNPRSTCSGIPSTVSSALNAGSHGYRITLIVVAPEHLADLHDGLFAEFDGELTNDLHRDSQSGT
jgi:hypothetical protein